MYKIHAKSPCCGERIIRYGKRRRKCTACARTWRIRKRRRGRKRIRRTIALIERVFRAPCVSPASGKGIPAPTLRARFRRTLQWFLAHRPSLTIPDGPLVLIVDGLWFKFQGVHWVLYLCALKSPKDSAAYFLDPIFLEGREVMERWLLAIAAIPAEYRERIISFVSDGFHGSKRIIARYGWIHQRCHFHLIAQLQMNRGIWKLKNREERPLREKICQDVRAALEEPDDVLCGIITKRLQGSIALPACPRRLRIVVQDFLVNLDSFRAYLRYPDINLPATTNTLESMNHLIRGRTRMLPTPASLRAWATALIRVNRKLVCNGRNTNRIK